METKGQAVTASWINVILGAWLIISPFVLGFSNGAERTNDILLGAIIGILALIRAFTPTNGTVWLSWINIIAGVWVIISPFALGYAHLATMWDNVIVGIIVTVDAIWNSAAGGHVSSARHAHS